MHPILGDELRALQQGPRSPFVFTSEVLRVPSGLAAFETPRFHPGVGTAILVLIRTPPRESFRLKVSLADGGRFAHQGPYSIMDNIDNAGASYPNNASIFHFAFILLSVVRSVSVAGSDIGPKVLNMIVAH
jgi:hypothetical protein